MNPPTHMHWMTPLAALMTAIALWFTWPGAAQAGDSTLPPPVAALAKQGLEIAGTFEAPAGLTGYAASFHGRPLAIYLTRDGKHAIVGTLINANGDDLTAAPLKRLVSGPQGEKAWAKLASSHWVRDGSKDAKVIIYEFTDANCPYCHQFWELAKPWVEAGKVQIRHVMVGVIKPSSIPKAATILAASDPRAAFIRNEKQYANGGIKVTKDIPDAARRKVARNNQLMQSLGYFATPTIFYKTPQGEVEVKQGLPQGDAVEEILGPKP